MPKEITVKFTIPDTSMEGYEDVCDELIIEDHLRGCWLENVGREVIVNQKCEKLAEALRWALDYIDAIPAEAADHFPAMPGFERDYVEGLLK